MAGPRAREAWRVVGSPSNAVTAACQRFGGAFRMSGLSDNSEKPQDYIGLRTELAVRRRDRLRSSRSVAYRSG
jgi:hypothetical protein